MPRSTNAPASRKRRRNRLKQARGFRGGRSKLFRTATEAVDRADCMAYAHRRTRKRDFRRLWIARISAAVKPYGINYSTFMNGLNKSDIELNRKMLSEIAIHDPEGFKSIVETAKAQIS
jgi:large subunit ribosomal protein L20